MYALSRGADVMYSTLVIAMVLLAEGQTTDGLSDGPLGVQLPRRLTEKVPQESVTSEANNSS